MSKENKAFVRRYFEQVWNEGRLDRFEEFYAQDVVGHNGAAATDAKSMKEGLAMIRSAIPDINIALDDELAVEDKVVTRFTISGTHQGELFGIPATGKQLVWSGITIFRLSGDKIVEYWLQTDNLSMMQQLGAIPAPAAA
jgi:steroid delta-isomerase-like uncharacterized protein